jgi:hypothetical protein
LSALSARAQAVTSSHPNLHPVERCRARLDTEETIGFCIDLPEHPAETVTYRLACRGTNRDRPLAGDVAVAFLAQGLDQPQVHRLLSSEHFNVDGS